jgi:hypothetical protein
VRLTGFRQASLMAFLLFAPLPAAADEPLAKPWPKTVCSANSSYCAVMDPASWTTEVRIGEAGEVLWSMAGWFRLAALSDDGQTLVAGYDGQTLVAGYDGMNLLPLDYSPDLVILTFYRRGAPVAEVTLDDVIDDFAALERTVSHYLWGHYLGFDQRGRYLIETVDGRNTAFDPTTGAMLESWIR